jgi:hypothetical protein
MWTSILVVVVCVGLAVVIAGAVIKKPKERPIPFAAVLVVGFFCLKWAADSYVVPSLGSAAAASSSSAIAALNAMMSEVRLYRVIEKHEPALHARVKEELVELARTSASPAEAKRRGFELGRTLLTEMFMKHASNADDRSLSALSSVIVTALRQLDRRDPVACYEWMFGGMRQLNAFDLIDARTQSRLMDSMTDVIESGATRQSTHYATNAQLAELFKPLAKSDDPRIRTGATIFMGVGGGAFDRDSKAAACYTAVEVYARIKALPPYRAGPVLRSMFRQA